MQPLETVFTAIREAIENIKADFIKLQFKYFATTIKRKFEGIFLCFSCRALNPPPHTICFNEKEEAFSPISRLCGGL